MPIEDDDEFYDESSYQEWDSSDWDEDEDRVADFIYQEEREEW